MAKQREDYVRKNVANLIKSLTGYQEMDENFEICQQFAFSVLKNHQFLSTNSKECHRRIDGFVERCVIANYNQYANEMKILSEKFISYSLCTNHYFEDIQWSILIFFLEIAQNPIGSFSKLTKNSFLVNLPENNESEADIENKKIVDFTNTNDANLHPTSYEDSLLSDWSSSSDDDDGVTYHRTTKNELQESEGSFVLSPVKSNAFKLFKLRNAKDGLRENVYDSSVQVQREYMLIREIIWMFIAPTNCKFFRIENNTVLLEPNSNLASTWSNFFHSFMNKITRYMNYMTCLETFCKTIFNGIQNEQHGFYESYALAIQQILEPFKNVLLRKESETILQNKIISVVNFFNEMEFQFSILECLYEIHKSCIIESNDKKTHIRSMCILSSLLKKVGSSSNLLMNNLALAIYLSSFKGFFSIIESWWTTGGANELLLSETLNFITEIIEEDVVTKIILKHAHQAGNTFNILSSLDRLHAVYLDSLSTDNLHNQFLMKIFEELEKFKTSNVNDEEWVIVERFVAICSNDLQTNKKNEKKERFSSNEMLLFTSFDYDDKECSSDILIEMNAFAIFVKLNELSPIILPAEQIVSKKMMEVLETKMSASHKAVINIYIEEFNILTHLKNLRKIYLYGASYLMDIFFTKLFRQIESSDKWMKSNYCLTVDFDDHLTSHYPEMSSLFNINVSTNSSTCKTKKVLDAIDKLTLNYNVVNHLSNIITVTALQNYNNIFRFILKVKWGLVTLENLRFAKLKRLTSTEFNQIDFVAKRLSIIRFWMIYSIQCIHSHLMTQYLETLGLQLDLKLKKSSNIDEMILIHQSFMDAASEHCFQNRRGEDMRIGIQQLLDLVIVLREEWENVTKIHSEQATNLELTDLYLNAVDLHQHIEDIEKTYIRCHRFIATTLNEEIYRKNNLHLTGLNAAFSCSLPY